MNIEEVQKRYVEMVIESALKEKFVGAAISGQTLDNIRSELTQAIKAAQDKGLIGLLKSDPDISITGNTLSITWPKE